MTYDVHTSLICDRICGNTADFTTTQLSLNEYITYFWMNTSHIFWSDARKVSNIAMDEHFSKVSCVVTFYKYLSSELTFEKSCQMGRKHGVGCYTPTLGEEHDSCMCETYVIYMWELTHYIERRDSFTLETGLIHMAVLAVTRLQ